MISLAGQQFAAVMAYRDAHPEIDWDHHIVYLRHNADDTWEASHHKPKTAFDYKIDKASCWCCMEEVCTCDPPHPH